MTKLCIILANARSGTLGLGTGIERIFGAKWIGEVFHSNNADPTVTISPDKPIDQAISMQPELNYFNYKQHVLKNNIELAYPSLENQRELFDGYIKHIAESIDNELAILDVKYSSWHHFNSYWMMPMQRPVMANFVRESGLDVVHIVRNNYFSQYCSMKVALHTGVWHLRENEEHTIDSLQLDPADCENRMKSFSIARKSYMSAFANYDHHRVVNYEDIFRENKIAEEVIDLFSEIFEKNPMGENLTPIRKTTPALREIIANKEEIIEYFSDTEFSEMVDEVLCQ